MTPTGLDHIVLQVKDIDQSLAFYADLLGLTTERLSEYRKGAAPFVSVRAGSTLIDLFPAQRPGPGPHHLCLTFKEPIDDLAHTLHAAGLAFDPPEPRFGAQGTGFSVYVKDPDGHTIEIRSYHEADK